LAGSSGCAFAAKAKSAVRPRSNMDTSVRAGVFAVFIIYFLSSFFSEISGLTLSRKFQNRNFSEQVY
jgi:hypothetical protein